ncbi:hypothetical protein NFI96_003159 [Prochilodus magdalenae]|nr:hypothetical protein NFI96_003159 [Prochilodus magdalenae]
MAASLRKYKYNGTASSRPKTLASQSAADRGETPPSPQPEPAMDTAALRADVLSLLKTDISAIIKSELKSVLAEEFSSLKSELKEVKAEILNNTAAIRTEMDAMKHTISDMEEGLSSWSSEVTELRTTVAELKTEMADLKEKCEDLEGRMRRCNIRIVGIAEEPGSCSTTAVSNLLKEVLHLEKDILVDRSHRGLTPRKPNGKPRVVIAKLHYYQDCVDVLRRARESGPLRYKGEPIAIFPDYTTKVAKARAAFNDVRNLLRGRHDVRYGIIFPARLRISFNGDVKEFLEPEKAMTYVKGITAT